MAFTNSFRMERVYFERLKSMIDILKPYLNTETDEKLKSILENSIDDNGAILLLYRNLGECWAELSDLIKKADEKIDSLDDKSEKYHDELNERIDEVNNYIMGILREIEARLEAVEQDLATLSRNIILDLERVNDDYTLSYKGDPVDFAQLAEWVSFPDNVIVRGVVNGEETVFHLREFDTDETSGVFEFFATGLIDNVVHEITVTVLPDDSVTVATVTQTMKEYLAGNGINISSNDEISVDFDIVQEKLTAGIGISIDPDTNEISAETHIPLTPFKEIYANAVTLTDDISYTPDSPSLTTIGQIKNFNIRGKTNEEVVQYTKTPFMIYYAVNRPTFSGLPANFEADVVFRKILTFRDPETNKIIYQETIEDRGKITPSSSTNTNGTYLPFGFNNNHNIFIPGYKGNQLKLTVNWIFSVYCPATFAVNSNHFTAIRNQLTNNYTYQMLSVDI